MIRECRVPNSVELRYYSPLEQTIEIARLWDRDPLGPFGAWDHLGLGPVWAQRARVPVGLIGPIGLGPTKGLQNTQLIQQSQQQT